MSKNLIPEICKLLGVELGEEFKLKDNHDNSLSNETYKFSKDALLYKYQDTDADAYCLASSITLCSLLTGDVEVSKLPWKPKKNEAYYTFGANVRGVWRVILKPCWEEKSIL